MRCLENLEMLKAHIQKALGVLNDNQVEQPLQKLALISQVQILDVAILQCMRCDEEKAHDTRT